MSLETISKFPLPFYNSAFDPGKDHVMFLSILIVYRNNINVNLY